MGDYNMDIKQRFIEYLSDKGKKQDYIDMSKELLAQRLIFIFTTLTLTM